MCLELPEISDTYIQQANCKTELKSGETSLGRVKIKRGIFQRYFLMLVFVPSLIPLSEVLGNETLLQIAMGWSKIIHL